MKHETPKPTPFMKHCMKCKHHQVQLVGTRSHYCKIWNDGFWRHLWDEFLYEYTVKSEEENCPMYLEYILKGGENVK